MAGKTKEMSQIKQLLLLKQDGVSNRKAAGIVGINKETANNYVKKALADELGIDGLLKLDGPPHATMCAREYPCSSREPQEQERAGSELPWGIRPV